MIIVLADPPKHWNMDREDSILMNMAGSCSINLLPLMSRMLRIVVGVKYFLNIVDQ